jgi:hypothetical protein
MCLNKEVEHLCSEIFELDRSDLITKIMVDDCYKYLNTSTFSFCVNRACDLCSTGKSLIIVRIVLLSNEIGGFDKAVVPEGLSGEQNLNSKE